MIVFKQKFSLFLGLPGTQFLFSTIANTEEDAAVPAKKEYINKGFYTKPFPITKDNPNRNKGLTEDAKVPLNVHIALDSMRESAWAKFDESVDLAIRLGVDPRKPNQSIKGVARLPHGTGKNVRVCVFATGADAIAASEAGAEVVGSDDLVTRIQGGDLPFDAVIATPEMMGLIAKIGKILGPKGMMPTPKMGSVTKEVAKAVKAAKAGAVQFRVEKAGIIHACVGKLSFTNEKLIDNIRAFMVAVGDAKPEGLKGKFILKASMSSTMGRGIVIETANIDPINGKFMLDLAKIGAK